MRQIGRLVVAIVVSAGLACGSKSTTAPSSSTTTTTTPPSTFNGTWSGRGAAGGSTSSTGIVSFDFTVANNAVTRFAMTYRFAPGSAGCSFTSTTSAAIANNGFSYPFSSAGVTTTITGTLSSGTQGTGTVARLDFANVQCGGTINGFAGGESLTFTKS